MSELINCPICELDHTDFVTDRTRGGTNWIIVKCRGCGLVYMNPRPTAGELAVYYEREYRTTSPSPEKFDAAQIDRARQNADEIARFTGLSGASVFDIGCATGTFLQEMKARGWQTDGVEPGDAYREYGTARGLDIMAGGFEDAILDGKKFDVITSFQTLEHVANPIGFLEKVRASLRPGGFYYADMPNINNLYGRILNVEPRDEYFQPAHLFYYSPKTLSKMLEKSGFEVTTMRTRGTYEVGIGWSIASFFRSPYQSCVKTAVMLENGIREKVGYGLYIIVLARIKPAAS